MPDLSATSRWSRIRSHERKTLEAHTAGVARRTVARTELPIARAAALLHDVGKLNPFFQGKLPPNATTRAGDYSSHAYLSALATLGMKVQSPFGRAALGKEAAIARLRRFALILLIARHHGSLPNCIPKGNESECAESTVRLEYTCALSEAEYERARAFLRAHPELPFHELAADLAGSPGAFGAFDKPHAELPTVRLELDDALAFFQETQFAFACLIESDKRDAGDNADDRRAATVQAMTGRLLEAVGQPPTVAEGLSAKALALNRVRQQIRGEALAALGAELDRGERRVFCLSAPTGSGKTRTLLAAAAEILRRRNGPKTDESAADTTPPALRGILYCLPFLSITEQVEAECGRLGLSEYLLRADSAAAHPTIERLIREAETDSSAAERLLQEEFAELTFDSPLIITTFVQFFETLMSNRNATLLKLPNFARSVVLIDEYQALPPRLYTFFAAYLEAFCRRFDSYVILSTATMPNLQPKQDPLLRPERFFPAHSAPPELVSAGHFASPCFRRYRIEPRWDVTTMEALSDLVQKEAQNAGSVMVILNTIPDTRRCYALLQQAALDAPSSPIEIQLLNTRFTPQDRRKKIADCRRSPGDAPFILVTTQLVEAGVDLDFPLVVRDLCPLPNLIQTAGRCNRHDLQPEPGRVLLVDLQTETGRLRADTIYLQDVDRWYLEFTRESLTETVSEEALIEVQQAFFNKVRDNLILGQHPGLRDVPRGAGGVARDPSNLLLCIRDGAFEDAGKFRLIREEGETFAFYVAEEPDDPAMDTLSQLVREAAEARRSRDFERIRIAQRKVEAHLRIMHNRVVQARLKPEEALALIYGRPVLGIYPLLDLRNYSFERGLEVSRESNFI